MVRITAYFIILLCVKTCFTLEKQCKINENWNDKTISKYCHCAYNYCYRKCCQTNEYYQILNSTILSNCTRMDNIDKFNSHVYNLTIIYNDNETIVADTKRPYMIIPDQDCAKDRKEDLTSKLYLQKNGSLIVVEEDGYQEVLSLTEYCFEYVHDVETDEHKFEAFSCFPAEHKKISIMHLSIGMIISIPFLFLTFAVYAIIPELQNLHGKSLMCYVFTLMFAYTLLAFIQLSPTQTDPWCEVIAFSIYYLFLVSFFWLNVMCFDIWWTFSGIGGFKSSFRNAEQKKFLFYNLYAWGVPTTIVMLSALLQYHPSVPETWNKPKLGSGGTCWFDDKSATLLYFHFPLFFVITCNVLLFVSTAIKIIKIKRDTAMLKTKDSQRHESANYTKDKQRFALYLKLFVVMGVNWTMELISVIFETNDTQTSYAWLLTDLGNTLHGVLIFIIFVCKRQIWALLVKRYHVMMGRPYQANVAFSRTQTTSYSVSQSTDTNVSQHGSVKLNNFN